MPYASFSYRVQRTEIVEPSQIEITRDVGYERLVLSACHPLYSAAQRIVVFAKLDSISLFGQSDRRWLDP
jgi:sortase A